MSEPTPSEPAPIPVQLALYAVVGGAATAADLGGFAALTALGLPTIAATPLSFLAGTATNYVASVTLAFRRGRRSLRGEIAALVVVVGVGLALNALFVALFLALLPIRPLTAKALAIPCALGWNFLGRRWLVFRPELPELGERVLRLGGRHRD
jgi:putative flippase GtrA